MNHIQYIYNNINTKSQLIDYIEKNEFPIEPSRQSTLQSLTDLIIIHLYNTLTAKTIKKMIQPVQMLVKRQTEKLNTQSDRFQRHRSALKKRFTGVNQAIINLHYRSGLDFEEYQARNESITDSRDEKLSNRIVFDEGEIMELLNKWKNSTNIYENIASLELASGSRQLEIVRKATFEPVDNETLIKITNVAKKSQTVTITRPLLGFTSVEFISLLNKVRETLKQLNPDWEKYTIHQVNNRIHPEMKNILKETPVQNQHSLRSIYANMVYNRLPQNEQDKVERLLFIKNLLSHESESSTMHYLNVVIKEAKEEPVEEEEPVEIKTKDQNEDEYEDEEKDGFVRLKTVDEKFVFVEKAGKLKRGFVQEKIIEIIDTLVNLKIRPTINALKMVGFGSKSINKVNKYRLESVDKLPVK
jgi:integrase